MYDIVRSLTHQDRSRQSRRFMLLRRINASGRLHSTEHNCTTCRHEGLMELIRQGGESDGGVQGLHLALNPNSIKADRFLR